MSKEDIELDLMIKYYITKELEAIEVPPVDEAWEKFKARYEKELRPRNSIKKVVSIAAAIILSLSVIAYPLKATALGEWIVKTARFKTGKTTENITTSYTRGQTEPAVPTVVNLPIEDKKELTMEEAQREVPFKIAEPTYLPQGSKVSNVTLQKIAANSFIIEVAYDINGQRLLLNQQNIVGTFSEGILFDKDDMVFSELDINGNKGTRLRLKSGTYLIKWVARGLRLELYGKLSEEEITRIALSIK